MDEEHERSARKQMFIDLMRQKGYRFQSDLAKAIVDNSDHYSDKTLESIRPYLSEVILGKKPPSKPMKEVLLSILGDNEEINFLLSERSRHGGVFQEFRNKMKKEIRYECKDIFLRELYVKRISDLGKYFQNSDDSDKLRVLVGLESLVR